MSEVIQNEIEAYTVENDDYNRADAWHLVAAFQSQCVPRAGDSLFVNSHDELGHADRYEVVAVHWHVYKKPGGRRERCSPQWEVTLVVKRAA